ncbi:MAG: PorT family protein [Candidatus Marinimicrobia bacterium]|nr:PorT family protein [Candidatus Neomarinimicrobiota bacterium]
MCFCLIISVSNAQILNSFGLKIGMVNAKQDWNYSGMFSGLEVYNETRLGLNIGGYIEWNIFPSICVSSEIHYIQKGAKNKIPSYEYSDGTGNQIQLTPRLDYLSIPIIFNFHYIVSKLVLYGMIGPKLDLLVGKNEDAVGYVFDELKTSELGYTFGFGVVFGKLGGNNIGLEIRKSRALENAYSNENLTVSNYSTEFLLVVGL